MSTRWLHTPAKIAGQTFFSMGWYYVITQEMRDNLALAGNDLLVFAILHGYSQKEEGCYFGSAASLGERCGIRRETTVRILKKLTEAGYIKKGEIFRNGVRYCTYTTCDNLLRGVSNCDGGCIKMQHNNKGDNESDGFINKPLLSSSPVREKKSFTPPTVEEVRSYCFERGGKVDAEAFVAFYESNGWKVGRNPMKDWKAAVITWEKREAQQPSTTPSTPFAPASPRGNYVRDAMMVSDRLFGTNYTGQKGARAQLVAGVEMTKVLNSHAKK